MGKDFLVAVQEAQTVERADQTSSAQMLGDGGILPQSLEDLNGLAIALQLQQTTSEIQGNLLIQFALMTLPILLRQSQKLLIILLTVDGAQTQTAHLFRLLGVAKAPQILIGPGDRLVVMLSRELGAALIIQDIPDDVSGSILIGEQTLAILTRRLQLTVLQRL